MISTIELDDIVLSNTQSQQTRRKSFDKKELGELVESIRRHGVLQPIVVRDISEGNSEPKFELIAGERRLLASIAAETGTIPANVVVANDEQVIEIQLTENLQREGLHPMQEAEGYDELINKHGRAIDEIHEAVGKSKSYVYKRMRLLDMCKKGREAFYKNEITVAQALLVARIPDSKMQETCIEELTSDWNDLRTLKDLREHIQDEFMLDISKAPFKPGDAELVPAAGSCLKCPKLTGNQAELFDDIKGKRLCIDPECFKSKKVAHGQHLIKAAKTEGKPVLQGPQLKKVAPYGLDSSSLKGFKNLDQSNYEGKHTKSGYQTNREILKNDLTGIDVTVAIDKEGNVAELVPDAVINKALNQGKKTTTKAGPNEVSQATKNKRENAFRRELYARIREKIEEPSWLELASTIVDRLEHDYLKVLCEVRGFEPPKNRGYGGKDYRAITKTLTKMDDEELVQFVIDCMYSRLLLVANWSSSSAKLLLDKAKELGVDPRAVRKEMAPKPKAKPKAKAKKAAPKKPAPGKRKKDLDPFVHSSV